VSGTGCFGSKSVNIYVVGIGKTSIAPLLYCMQYKLQLCHYFREIKTKNVTQYVRFI